MIPGSRYDHMETKFCTANASKLIEKNFLDLTNMFSICSQIKKILEYFSQNKKNKFTEKIFLSLLQENLT